MTSERRQIIEQVAGAILHAGWEYDYDSAAEYAAERNAEGWGIEVRLDTEGPGSYTQIQGEVLPAAELALAGRLAAEWAAGHCEATAADLLAVSAAE